MFFVIFNAFYFQKKHHHSAKGDDEDINSSDKQLQKLTKEQPQNQKHIGMKGDVPKETVLLEMKDRELGPEEIDGTIEVHHVQLTPGNTDVVIVKDRGETLREHQRKQDRHVAHEANLAAYILFWFMLIVLIMTIPRCLESKHSYDPIA